MIPTLIITSIIVFLFVFIVLRGRRGDITPQKARELVSAGATLIDVRTPAEFASEHLPGAVNVPLQQLGQKLSTLKKHGKRGPLIVYCLSGSRSASAQRILRQELKVEVHNLGALSRW